MNRAERRAHEATMRRKWPEDLTPVPKEKWPDCAHDENRKEVWVSRKFLVQVFNEGNGVKRISVNRSTVQPGGRWVDGISWDELQQIKADVGYADYFAVEIYPRRRDEVNEAAMRHLWILPEPLDIGWRKG